MPSYVGSVGSKSARIALFGEAPAKYEVIKGEPFCGVAGDMLDKVLQRAGIIRSVCYIDNIIRERLPNDKVDSMYQDKSNKKPTPELWKWFEDAWDRVNQLNANVVVAMGELALRCLVDTKFEEPKASGVTSWRGSVLPGRPEIKGRKVLVSIHPQYVNYQSHMYPIFQFDMNRVRKESESPEIDVPERMLQVARGPLDVDELVARCSQADSIAIDIETRRDQIACIGFAISPTWAMTVPLTTSAGRFWDSVDLEAWVWEQIATILESDTPKIFQHAMYDCPWLSRNGFRTKNVLYDTMLMMSILYPEMPKSLEFMQSIFTPWPYYKDDVKDWKTVDDEVLWAYNAKDCAVTHEICGRLLHHLDNKGLLEFYQNHTHKLLSPVFKTMVRGINFDLPLRAKLQDQFKTKAAALQIQLNAEMGRELNVRSPKQMDHWLYVELGLKPITKMKKRKTDEDSLIKLARAHDIPALKTALALRKHRNFLSKEVNILIDADKRFRCTFNVAGTDTGRFSSSKSGWGTGKNAQTIPGVDDPGLYRFDARVMYIADPGYTSIVGDLEQAEDRWVVWLSEDVDSIRSYEAGEDQYIKLAVAFFGEAVLATEESNPVLFRRYREICKVGSHSGNYGIGWSKLRDEVLDKVRIWLEAPEAKRLLSIRAMMRPNLRFWHMEIRDQVRATRTMETQFGRRRTFYGRLGEETFRKAFAYEPQSSVSDTVKRAAIAIDEKYPFMEYLLDSHDGLAYQVPDDRVAEGVGNLEEEMTQTFVIKGRELTVPVEIKYGKSLGDLKVWPPDNGG